MTDGNGPEVFTPCAKQWVNPDNTKKDKNGKYVNLEGRGQDKRFGNKYGQCSVSPNPSRRNPLCEKYYDKIYELRYTAFINLHM